MKKRHKVGLAAVIAGGVAGWVLSRRDRAIHSWEDVFSLTNRVRMERALNETRSRVEKKALSLFRSPQRDNRP